MTVVLEVVEEATPRRAPPGASAGREKSPQLLQFISLDAENDHGERQPEVAGGAQSRRTSRDPAAPIAAAREATPTVKAAGGGGGGGGRGSGRGAGAAVCAAEYARCRTRLAGWLFRPLLSDAFALASLTQALSLLGLGGGDGQAAVLIRDMAAWFLALPVGRAADTTVGREAQNCPVLRWLKGVVLAWASPPPPSSLKRSVWDHHGGGGAIGRSEGEKSFLDERAAPVTPASAAAAGGAGAGGMTGGRIAGLFEDPVGGGGASASATATATAKDGGIFGDDESFSPSAEVSDAERQQEEEEEEEEEEADDEDPGSSKNLEARAEEILRPMFEACAASQRLENASMLSVVTAEALAACREKLEESSLGQVAIGGGEAWVTLARRLRLCLFVDHRLHWGVRTEQRWA